ncbi:MAG: hypothetical protein ACJ75J_12240 [Cytophagaceae bacterium]
MPKILFHLIVLFILAPLWSGAQVRAMFLEDSVKIGEPLRYSLCFTHPPETEFLMPDSMYNYYPFEFIRKEYFPTRTTKNVSRDSIIYYLRTFETGKLQRLSLPVFILNHGDSTYKFSSPDTIILKEMVKTMPDSLILFENVSLSRIEKEYNYPYAITTAVLSLLTLFIGYLTLGKSVRRRYRLFIIRRSHHNFLRHFGHLEDDFDRSKNTGTIEQALSLWKTYISRLENKPVNTFTTTELIALFNKEDLKTGLQTIDKAIYGGLISADTENALKSLRKFSEKRFRKRKKEILNA